jgi:hypothetical protein
MSCRRSEPIKHQRSVDSGPHRALGLVLRQIHIIHGALREGALGLDLLLLNVDGGIQALSDHAVAHQATEDTQDGFQEGAGNTLNPRLPLFAVEIAEGLVEEASLQPQALRAGAEVPVEVLRIIHAPSIVCLQLHQSKTSRSRSLGPTYLGRQVCCPQGTQNPIARELSLMATI